MVGPPVKKKIQSPTFSKTLSHIFSPSKIFPPPRSFNTPTSHPLQPPFPSLALSVKANCRFSDTWVTASKERRHNFLVNISENNKKLTATSYVTSKTRLFIKHSSVRTNILIFMLLFNTQFSITNSSTLKVSTIVSSVLSLPTKSQCV